MKLYAFSATPNNRKVAAYIRHYRLDVEIVDISFRDKEHQTPEFLAMNPMGKVPTLTDDDFNLWESNAILLYLGEHYAEQTDFPSDLRQRTDISRWLFWQSSHLLPPIGAIMKGDDEAAPEKVEQLMDVLDQQLSDREFICGDLSIADFSIAAYLLAPRSGGKIDLSNHANVRAWKERAGALRGFQLTAPKL